MQRTGSGSSGSGARSARRAGASLIALSLLLFACVSPSTEGASAATAPVAAAGVPRLPDGLLERVDLQRVVDATLARDADSLIGYLGSSDPAIRARAAFGLASAGAARAAPALVQHLTDADARVREDVAFAIGQVGDSAACDRVLDALAGEQSRRVRYLMLQAIGKCGSRSTLERLLASGARPEDYEGMAIALGAFGRRGIESASGGTLLLRLIESSEGDVPELAALALSAPRATHEWSVSLARVAAALEHLPRSGTAAAPLLTLLGRAEDRVAPTDILFWLDSAANWRTRVAAARALSRWTDRSDVRQALKRALDDPSIHVATSAAEVLSGTERPTPADRRAWETWILSNRKRWQVARLLLPGVLAAGDTDFVMRWARHAGEPPIPRWAGYETIAKLDDREAFEMLVEALAGPDRRESYIAAGALAERLAGQPLPRSDVDRVAAALGARLPIWGPHAPGSDVRGVIALITALDSIGTPAAATVVRHAAEHPHPSIRRVARSLVGAPPDGYVVSRDTRIDWAYLSRLGPHPRIRIRTERGELVVELDTEAAPLTTYMVARFVEDGFYDALTFHRVEPDFIIQSGDYENTAGFGGPWAGLVSEFTRIPFRRGTIGMASSARDTEGSQYFITHGSSTSLDGRYTAFGRVVEGSSVVDAVALGDSVISVRLLR